MPFRIQLFYFDAGGGHRAAATALKAAIDSQCYDWQVELVNLQEVLDPIDLLRRWTGIRVQDFYNLLLKHQLTLGTEYLLRVLHRGIRWYHSDQVRLLRQFWDGRVPDMVVSLIPHFNRALGEAFRSFGPGKPFVTILTDLADFPPHYWIEPEAGYVICGTERAVEQALELGLAPEQIFRVSGMIVRPAFYEPLALDRQEERRRLGLEPDRPTGLILFGGYAPGRVEDIVKRLARSDLPVQLIVICGRNDTLRRRLAGTRFPIPIHVLGFTDQLPYYMRLADFFIGKPGPGSLSEAVVMDLPVIVECNAWTLPQERYNAQWIQELGIGIVLRSFRDIRAAVAELLQPANFEKFRQNARRVCIRAVFEIPPILREILSRQPFRISGSAGERL